MNNPPPCREHMIFGQESEASMEILGQADGIELLYLPTYLVST